MAEPAVIHHLDERGVATVTFNRPEVNNAYNGELLQGVLDAMDGLGGVTNLRAVVLKGNGRHFQAGADLKWVRSILPQPMEAIRAASRVTAEVIDRLNRLPVPVIALVQGGCFGGGTGVVAASDIVIAADNAIFSIAEVRWGLHASIIVPHLNDAIGVRQARRYALSGERFDANEARRIGLVHEVVPLAALEAARGRDRGAGSGEQPTRRRPHQAAHPRERLGRPRSGGARRVDRQSRRGASLARRHGGSRLVRREALGELGTEESVRAYCAASWRGLAVSCVSASRA